MRKIEKLAEIEGFDSVEEMLDVNIDESVVPGICMNSGCTFTTGVEPDQDKGYCEECRTNTVKSCMVLAGVI